MERATPDVRCLLFYAPSLISINISILTKKWVIYSIIINAYKNTTTSKITKSEARMHALALIDIQNDYFSGGKMELVGSESAGENVG